MKRRNMTVLVGTAAGLTAAALTLTAVEVVGSTDRTAEGWDDGELVAAADPGDVAEPDDLAAPDGAAEPGARQGLPAAGKWRLRLRLRRPIGVHGEATVRRHGKFVRMRYQRGRIVNTTGTEIAVVSLDGTRQRWKIDGNTHIRRHGKRASASSLAKGDAIFVTGLTGDQPATLVVVPHRGRGWAPSESSTD